MSLSVALSISSNDFMLLPLFSALLGFSFSEIYRKFSGNFKTTVAQWNRDCFKELECATEATDSAEKKASRMVDIYRNLEAVWENLHSCYARKHNEAGDSTV